MKFPPMAHQTAAVERAGDAREFALFMETGTGKAKTVLMRAVRLAKLSQLLVVAPNGVHKDWVKEQVRDHWPHDELSVQAAYHSVANRASERKAVDALFSPVSPAAFRILTVNIDSLITPKGFDLCVRFMGQAPTMIYLDESDMIKTPSAKRTRRAQTLALHAHYRMIGTGTEVAEGPLDLYSQFQFLKPGLLGCKNFAVFKARYAEWRERIVGKGESQHKFMELVRYKNLEELRANVAKHSFRTLKKDCLDIPEALFKRRTVVLGPEQRRIYNAVKARVLAELDSDRAITTAHILTKMTRLAQIAGGFVRYDDSDEAGAQPIPGPNAKLDSLRSMLTRMPQSTHFIVWARFVPELRAISAMMTALGITHGRYWGEIPQAGRDQGATEFKAGRRRGMVAQQQAGGRGHTWVRGTVVFYYSNGYSWIDRKQSLDRAHRIGQHEQVLYIDIVAEDTQDVPVLTALKAKESVADFFKARPRELLA